MVFGVFDYEYYKLTGKMVGFYGGTPKMTRSSVILKTACSVKNVVILESFFEFIILAPNY